MLTGTVKFVEPGGRYGFISRDDKQPKVFLHISAVIEAGYCRDPQASALELRSCRGW